MASDHDDRSNTSLRTPLFRRPSNVSPSSSQFTSQLDSKHAYLSPEERRYHAEAAWSDASISPLSSNAVSPNVNYDRELPQLPPDALGEINTNRLASRDLPRTDDEVGFRHVPEYGPSSPSNFKSDMSSKSSAALRFASASTSAAVSAAGVGLKKLGKKASAARLRRANTSQGAAERDASYAAMRDAYSPHSATCETPSDDSWTRPGFTVASGSQHPRSHSRNPSNAEAALYAFVDHADPAIGLPYDVAHNVHVDIGPQGYTGLPASWASILLSEGMDNRDVHADPSAAARLIMDKTEFYVQRAVHSGGDADDTRRVLSQRLAQDPVLSAAVASNAHLWPAGARRGSDHSRASTSYSSVLEAGWDLSAPRKTPSSDEASSLPSKSPLLPDFAAEDYDDWATSLLSSIPSAANDKQSNPAKGSQKSTEPVSRRQDGLSAQQGEESSLNGLGIGMSAHDTPKYTVQRDRVPSHATPKASQRMRAAIGMDPGSDREA
uniref:CRIB domain-containing protein n=1 Tax=Kalmanozyma brasiliensis (strain GHG001) TaxID=1365824 RepID=V5EZ37_KALBG